MIFSIRMLRAYPYFLVAFHVTLQDVWVYTYIIFRFVLIIIPLISSRVTHEGCNKTVALVKSVFAICTITLPDKRIQETKILAKVL